jgi:hypothetical protein
MLVVFGLLFRNKGKSFEANISILFLLTAGVYAVTYIGFLFNLRYTDVGMLLGDLFFMASNFLVYYLFTHHRTLN